MKIHTRLKRKYGLTSSFKHINFFRQDEILTKGDRTFKTEKGAKTWADNKLGLKEKEYKIVPAKKAKKFKIERV